MRIIHVATKSVLSSGSKQLSENLAELHALIRAGRESEAVALYGRCVGSMRGEFYREDIRREAAFLKLSDASHSFGTEGSKRGVNPRQALISTALTGWYGDEPTSWPAPTTRTTLLAWADSHYEGPQERLVVALEALVAERLFFEVHPGVFAEPCYFCSYDAEFLAELPGGEQHRAMWERFSTYHDEHSHGWRSAGLCEGQGSLGYSEVVGVCLGSNCCPFEDGPEARCPRDLQYNPQLVEFVLARQRRSNGGSDR
jgi:hypothetical protein